LDTSLFLARMIGPVLLAIGIALLINQRSVREMAGEFLASKALIFMSGVLSLLGGLAIVLTHNVWDASWPVAITLFGWFLAIGGAFRIIFPDSVKSMGASLLDSPVLLNVSGVAHGLLGAVLCFIGYFTD
jgi:uncharacterized membrane protein HdeD (DUF308 family)